MRGYARKTIHDVERHHKPFCSDLGPRYAEIKDNSAEWSMRIDEAHKVLSAAGKPAKSTEFNFVLSMVYGACKGKIVFATMNSSALSVGTSKLRDKPQYRKNLELKDTAEQAAAIMGVPAEFRNILPDYDKRFPLNSCEELWQANLALLTSVSGIEGERLSSLSGLLYNEIEGGLPQRADYPQLQAEIDDFNSYLPRLIDFAADKDFVDQQIHSYAVTGLVLEQVLPHAVLLDVQKKRYPFEQPFYNRLRRQKMPIFYCGQALRR